MSAVHLESSAVVHWLLGQSRAAEVRQRIDQAEVVLVSALTLTETERVHGNAEALGIAWSPEIGTFLIS